MESRVPHQLNIEDVSPTLLTKHQNATGKPSSAILPLPPHVVSQLKSSATLTSLTGAILGLAQNALDAGASKLSIEVDFARGNCSVEDDGSGIAPAEFAEGGGLCKVYHTSKYASRSSGALYGTEGRFLASLAAMCLLTVTSKHVQHRSTNSLVIHQSKTISQLLPAPAAHRLESREKGTRVLVRDLFGNMPVRVKQRALLSQDQSELDKLWDELKSAMTALLVAFGTPVHVRMRDTASGRQLIFKSSDAVTLEAVATSTSLLSPKHLHALTLLQQAGKIPSRSPGSWIPASASSKSITIKGMISLTPVPSKAVQYLSLGIIPLLKSSHPMLYDAINRLFSRSRFGALEPEELTEEELERRRTDRRFKTEGLTKRQVGVEKGVERWPMFVLKIEVRDGRHGGEDILRSEASLGGVVRVLEALVGGWLEAHHFRAAGGSIKGAAGAEESVSSEREDNDRTRKSRKTRPSSSQLQMSRTVNSGVAKTARPYTGVATVNALSRIKSSRGAGSLSLGVKGKRATSVSPTEMSSPKSVINVEAFPEDWSRRTTVEGSQVDAQHKARPQDGLMGNDIDHSSTAEPHDEALDWIDPITKQKHRVNSRTGMPMPSQQTLSGVDQVHSPSDNGVRPRSRVSLPSRESRLPSTGTANQQLRFLDPLLEKWDNPVFRTGELPIPRASFDLPLAGETGGGEGTKEIERAFGEISVLSGNKISKGSLRNAEVIAQVDEKFVLVRVNATSDDNETEGHSSGKQQSLLVAIDQHAADERVKVERLLQELCTPPDENDVAPSSQQGLRSVIKTCTLGKPIMFGVPIQEVELLQRYAQHFANWGILFDIEASTSSAEDRNVVVHSVPPPIAERCRLDPKLLISLLRSEAWKLSETGASSSRVSTDDGTLSSSWIKRIADCPRDLLDMVNSRACRSAIMFNDVLDRDACEELVRELAGCALPFQCAHGRPSMVPLIELGNEHSTIGRSNLVTARPDRDEDDFTTAFLQWRKDE